MKKILIMTFVFLNSVSTWAVNDIYNCQTGIAFKDSKDTVATSELIHLDAEKGEVFRSQFSIQDAAGKDFEFNFYFKALRTNDQRGLKVSLSETEVVSPFDGSRLFHSDATGETVLSDSIINLVEPKHMVNSKIAFHAYNISVAHNTTGQDFFFNGRKINYIMAACQLGQLK